MSESIPMKCRSCGNEYDTIINVLKFPKCPNCRDVENQYQRYPTEKKIPNRYCYILRSAEKDVVGVFTALKEACVEGLDWAKKQGVENREVKIINAELTVILCKGGTPSKVWIERHRLK